jgi:hypothetical protein
MIVEKSIVHELQDLLLSQGYLSNEDYLKERGVYGVYTKHAWQRACGDWYSLQPQYIKEVAANTQPQNIEYLKSLAKLYNKHSTVTEDKPIEYEQDDTKKEESVIQVKGNKKKV